MDNLYSLLVTKTESYRDGEAKILHLTIVNDESEQYIWQSSPSQAGAKFYVQLPDELHWQAGQYMTLNITIGGETYQGHYPICSSLYSEVPLKLFVQQDSNDPVSDYIIEYVHVGDSINITAPHGEFLVQPSSNNQRSYYFFAQGDNIASVYPMISSLLIVEPHSRIHLLYDVTDESQILFEEELQWLLKQAPDNFNISYALSNPRVLSSFLYWHSGEVNAEMIMLFLEENPAMNSDSQCYISASSAMSELINKTLLDLKISSASIHTNTLAKAVVIKN